MTSAHYQAQTQAIFDALARHRPTRRTLTDTQLEVCAALLVVVVALLASLAGLAWSWWSTPSWSWPGKGHLFATGSVLWPPTLAAICTFLPILMLSAVIGENILRAPARWLVGRLRWGVYLDRLESKTLGEWAHKYPPLGELAVQWAKDNALHALTYREYAQMAWAVGKMAEIQERMKNEEAMNAHGLVDRIRAQVNAQFLEENTDPAQGTQGCVKRI